MAVIHIARNTKLAKLARVAKVSGLRLKWRPDVPAPGRPPARQGISPFPAAAPANDDGDLPPAA